MSDRASFPQNRLGNENRELDDYRARDGDFVTVAAGDTGTDVIVYTFPDDVQEFHLDEYVVSDLSGTAGTFELYDAVLDSNGNVSSTDRRTVERNFAADSDETFEYTGEPFTDDAIVVVTDSNAEFRVGGFADAKEEFEPGSEQTSV